MKNSVPTHAFTHFESRAGALKIRLAQRRIWPKFCVNWPDGSLPRRRMDGINYIQLYLPDIQIVVKVDQRQLPEIFTPIIVKPKPPHYLPFMPFNGSTEADYFERMKEAIR